MAAARVSVGGIVYDREGKPLRYEDEGVYIVQCHDQEEGLRHCERGVRASISMYDVDRMKLVCIDGEEGKCIARQRIWGGEKGEVVRESEIVQLISTGMHYPGWNIWTGGKIGISLNNSWTDDGKMIIMKKGDYAHEYILKFIHITDGSPTPSYVMVKDNCWLHLTAKQEDAMVVQFERREYTVGGEAEANHGPNATITAVATRAKPVLDCDGKPVHFKEPFYIVECGTRDRGPVRALGVPKCGNWDADYLNLLSVEGVWAKYIVKHQLWDGGILSNGEEREPVQEGRAVAFVSEGCHQPGFNIWTGTRVGIKMGPWFENYKIALVKKSHLPTDNKYVLRIQYNPVCNSPRVDWFYVMALRRPGLVEGYLRLTTYLDDALAVELVRYLPQITEEEKLPRPTAGVNIAGILLDWKGKPVHYEDPFYIVKSGTHKKIPILAVGLSRDKYFNYPKLVPVEAHGERSIAKQYMKPLEEKNGEKDEPVHELDVLCLISTGINWAGWNLWTAYCSGVKLYSELRMEGDGYKDNHKIKVVQAGLYEYVLKIYCSHPGFPSPHLTEWFYVAANEDGSLYLTTCFLNALVVQFARELQL